MLPKLLQYLALATALTNECYGIDHPVANETVIPAQWRESVEQAWGFTLGRSAVFPPSLDDYQNWALDQIIDGAGTINICMRWGSNTTLTEDTRQRAETMYRKQYEKWWEWLPGWDNYPFEKFNFNITGWAVSDRSLFEGSVDGFELYTDFKDEKGATCDPGCSRHLHQDGNYSACKGGPSQRYHQFFFLDPTWGQLDMGAASGIGVDISLYGWETVGTKLDEWPMLLHEFGHTFGFPDFITDGTTNHTLCDVLWLPPAAPTEFVMKPGDYGAHVPEVTEFEGWMLRHWWSRFSRLRGWQSNNMTFPPPPSCKWEL
ncbi:hypothetical protein ACMFMG_008688 [Clarireedia jacksonii]